LSVTVEHVAGRGDEGGGSAANATVEARRHFACPAVHGRYQGIELEYLDPADPDERRILLEAEHPELHRALWRDDDDDEVVIEGQPINPRLHIAMHEIVANQLWDHDPSEVWETAQRLVALGYERHEVLHMLCSVVAREVWNVMDSEEPTDPARYITALNELPESYFALSDEP
jgi:hypothetical protein